MNQARADLVKLAKTLRQSQANDHEDVKGRHLGVSTPSQSPFDAMATGLSSIGDRLMSRRARLRIP
ncbi:MAG: hypothetical protein WAN34_09730 [Acidimicrobiia bacterium]